MFTEAKDDGSGGDNWSHKSCKAPVKSSPPTNQHPVFLQAGCPSCHPTNSVKAPKGNITFHGLAYPNLTWGSSNFVYDHYSSWLPRGRVAMPLISPLMLGCSLKNQDSYKNTESCDIKAGALKSNCDSTASCQYWY